MKHRNCHHGALKCRKSSVKPPGDYLFQTLLSGGVGGGGLIETGGLFNLAKNIVSVLQNNENARWKDSSTGSGGHAAEVKKQIRTSSW